MADIRRVRFTLTDLKQGGEECLNPTITWQAPAGIEIVCEPGSDYIEALISPDATSHCVTFTIDCDDCDTCPSETFTECFCVDHDDCGDCEQCNETTGLCESFCPDDQICVGNDKCGECITAEDCDCNKICLDSTCVCPPGLPLERADGCCVECLTTEDCGPCEVCDGTNCIPKVCPDGSSCNPTTGDCQECLFDTDCTNPNECCQPDGTCDCCDGYYKDASGNCVAEPPCLPGDCPDCFDCDPILGCVPRVCPPGFVCVNDNCEPGCVDGLCPDGEGCINGVCVPCSELSCEGVGLLCEQATGCTCDDNNNCVGVDCNPSGVSIIIETTQATAGAITSPGEAALQGSGSATAIGILGPPIYQDHRIDLSISGVTGTWTLYNTPTDATTIGTNVGNVSFNLSDHGPNLVGFIVEVVTISGNRGRFEIYRDPTQPLDAANVWTVNFSSNGLPPETSGGTPGVTRACVSNGDWTISSINYTAVSGDIVVTAMGLDSDGCMILHIQGCGIATGTALVECGGLTQEIELPEIEVPIDACCDPQTDLDCPVGIGDACTSLTVTNIDLIAYPTYAYNGSGDGEFVVVADFTSVSGMTFSDLFYLNPSPSCWGTTGVDANLQPDGSGTNDLAITTGAESPLGGSVSALSVVVTMGDGGCVTFGQNCTLRISGCRRLEGVVCMEECANFSVYIHDDGSNQYTAYPSLNDAPVTFAWTYPSSTSPIGVTQTVTIVPQGGSTQLKVIATYSGISETCSATAILNLNTILSGCTDRTACNYDATANSPDGSCVYITSTAYNCSQGVVLGEVSQQGAAASISFQISGVPLANNDSLAAGTYVVDVISASFSCQQTLIVPQCYRCSGTNCLPAIPPTFPTNTGPYTADPTCDNQCDVCSDFQPATVWACDGTSGQVTLSATGASGTYTYTVQEDGGSFSTSGSFNTQTTVSGLCNGTYTVTINDAANPAAAACQFSETNTLTCFDCATSTLAITANPAADYCSTNSVVFAITDNSPCANTYVVSVDTGATVLSYSYSATGGTNASQVIALADGSYPVTVTDDNGCTNTATLVINCGGAPTCALAGSTTVVPTGVGVYRVDLDYILTNGSGSVQYTVFESTSTVTGLGDCAGAGYAGVSYDFGVETGATGTISFDIYDAAGSKCYKIIVNDLVDTTCNETFYVYHAGSSPAPGCSVDSGCGDITYNAMNETLDINWIFSNSPSGTHVVVEDMTACPAGSASNPVTYSFVGETGTIIHSVNPEPTATYYRVTITSVDDAACNLVCCITVPACTCSIGPIALTHFDLTSELEVDYTSSCTTQPTDLLITVDDAADGLCSGPLVNITTRIVGAESGVEIFTGIASQPTDRYIQVTIEDTTLGACVQTQCLTIPACTTCTTQTAILPSTRIANVTDGVTDYGFLGSGFIECAGASAVNDDFVADLEALLQANETCGTASVSWGVRPGIVLNQCLHYDEDFNSAGTDNVHLDELDINGTPYAANIVFATFTAGTPALVAGAAQTIADFYKTSLQAEGIEFNQVTVGVSISGSNVNLEVNISHVDNTEVIDVVAGIVASETTVTMANSPCTSAVGTESGIAEEGCILLTISGSGITLTYLEQSVGGNEYAVDISGC